MGVRVGGGGGGGGSFGLSDWEMADDGADLVRRAPRGQRGEGQTLPFGHQLIPS